MKVDDYTREVFLHLSEIDVENDQLRQDISGDGFEAEVRRKIYDDQLAQHLAANPPIRDFINALHAADISAKQSALVMQYLGMTYQRRERHGKK